PRSRTKMGPTPWTRFPGGEPGSRPKERAVPLPHEIKKRPAKDGSAALKRRLIRGLNLTQTDQRFREIRVGLAGNERFQGLASVLQERGGGLEAGLHGPVRPPPAT